MALHTISFDVSAIYSAGMPKLQIKYGGIKLDTSYVGTGSSTLSFQIDSDDPFDHTLLRFYSVKNYGSDGDIINISNVKIDSNPIDLSAFTHNKGSSGDASSIDLTRGSYSDYEASGELPDTDPGAAPLATITGTAGADKLYGTDVADVIDGLAGNDRLYGKDGVDTINGGDDNDIISGQDGDDILNGDAGNDKVYGNNGADTINGGTGSDRLYGNDGIDTIYGGADNDFIWGGNDGDFIYGEAGDDRLSGEAGDDTIEGGLGTDQLFGGDGNDTLRGGDGNDRVLGNDGNDTLYGDDGDDNIDGQLGNDTIYGGNDNDTIDGEQGDDILNGDAGNDTIMGGLGVDTINGGTGDDIIHGGGVSSYDQYVIRDTSSWGLSGVWYSEATNSFYRYININFDYTTANSNAQGSILNGQAGHLVTISSQAENDLIESWLDGGASAWTSGGGQGAGAEWTWSGGHEAGTQFSLGATSVDNAYVNWTGGEPNGAGQNYARLQQSDGTWTDRADTDTFHYFVEWEGETIQADNSANILNGDAGDDLIYGGSGVDTIDGGADNDRLFGLNGNDIIDGGAGDDVIYADALNQVVGEAGRIESHVQADGVTWYTVSFSEEIINPVIKMTMNTFNGGDPNNLRVRNVTSTGFEWQIDEWDYLDGAHGSAENISWLAVAAGRHTLDNGLNIEAGITSATNEGGQNVFFSSAFGANPIVMSQVMSDNDGAAVATRNRNVATDRFRVNMLEEENSDGVHATEDIGWIAIDGGGSATSGLLVGTTGDVVTHNTTNINFGGDLASTAPVVIMDMQRTDGGDTAVTRGATNVTSNGADVFIEEEASREAEIGHTTEDVGYLALTNGLLYNEGYKGNDTINGGAGLDILYGGDGADTFVFEAATVLETDIIMDFKWGQGDALDISDIIGGIGANPIANYVNFTEVAGDTLVSVDASGTSTFGSAIAQLNNVTGLDETLLYNNGGIIV